MRWWSVFSPIPNRVSEGGDRARERIRHDIGMSARTLAKSVMMMQRRSKQIRSAEAKQKHSAVSIGGEMARGSRHAVVAAAYLLLCEKEHRQALGAKSERNALVRSAGERRRSSRAAMWAGGDGWMAARRFSHFGQEPMNRRRGRGRVRGLWGRSIDFFVLTQMTASGLTAILLLA
jgi:hypothetical protein